MALGAVLVSKPARAAKITLQGTIATDDPVQLFDLTVAAAGSVDMRTGVASEDPLPILRDHHVAA